MKDLSLDFKRLFRIKMWKYIIAIVRKKKKKKRRILIELSTFEYYVTPKYTWFLHGLTPREERRGKFDSSCEDITFPFQDYFL